MPKPKTTPFPVRKALPAAVRSAVLMEAAYRCGNPRCNNILTLQIHHILWLKDGGKDDPSNLIALCGYCHDMHTQGHVPHDAIRLWKGLLVALNQAFDRESMDLLLYLNHHQAQHLWYSGDGVLRFARLIGRGLAKIAFTVIPRGLRMEELSLQTYKV